MPRFVYGPTPPPDHLPPLPEQSLATRWPTDTWPESPIGDGVDAERVERILAHSCHPDSKPELGKTYALLVVQRGELVAERYGWDHDRHSTLPSWSMAKSILHALIGVLVGEGRLRTQQPAPVPAWQSPGDPRRDITIDQLLRMSSGLRFLEEYEEADQSDTIRMLFGEGKADVAGYAAALPLEHDPGSAWLYSSGTSNILSAITARTLGLRGDDYVDWMRRVLFGPIGMRTSKPLCDESGTWIGSSFNFATARDFARFGLLYLRDGCWDGTRILPEGWVDYARTPTAHSEEQYGAHFWLAQDGSGRFSANGFQSQYILLDPRRDLVIVRLGQSRTDRKGALLRSLADLADAFPPIAG